MKEAISLFTVLILLTFAREAALAETLPLAGRQDPRVREAAYEPDQVYRLPAFVGYQVHLQFEPGERFQGLGAGDLEGLEFAAEAHHLFLKPKAPRIATNLTVLTSLRHYHFEYSASARRPDPAMEEVIYSLRFTYPPSKGAATDAALDAALGEAVGGRPKNFDYAYCGASALKPVAAFDDGVRTHLRFAARGELPAVFYRSADGAESLVNSTVEADTLIVHRVSERLIVRRGRLAGCIVNRAFAGAGERLESGTLTPAVRRRTRRSAP